MTAPNRAARSKRISTPEEAFGITLRKVRLRRDMSQQALADKSGYHRTYIGLLERGQKSPSLRAIFDIAMTLQVKPSRMVKSVEQVFAQVQSKCHRPRDWARNPANGAN